MPSTVVSGGVTATAIDARQKSQTIVVGGTAGLAGIAFTGDAAITPLAPTLDSASVIASLLPGQTRPGASLLQATGVFVNQGTVLANGPAGSSFTIAVQPAGTIAGSFINAGQVVINAGNTMTIAVAGTASFANSGRILANGGSLLIAAAAPGGLAPVTGLIAVAGGGTVEIAAAVPQGTGEASPVFAFLDASHDELTLDQPSAFDARIAGFAAGDTIDIGAHPVGTLTVASNGQVTLQNAGSVVATLQLSTGAYTPGTFIVTKGTADGFSIATAANGQTLLTTSLVNSVWAAGKTGTWGTTANWSTGTTPGTSATTVLGAAAAAYTLSTGTLAASAASLLMDGAQATLEVDKSLTLGPQALIQSAGTIHIMAGATLTAPDLSQIGTGAALLEGAGAVLELTGQPSTAQTVAGTFAIGRYVAAELEGSVTINGGMLKAGPTQPVKGATAGRIAIGSEGGGTPASVVAEAGANVTDTLAILGSGPGSYSALTITGATTKWTDATDPTDPADTTGAMLVGLNDQPIAGVATGAAQLTIANGATLTEASYAEIAPSAGSGGTVTVSGARWNIGAATGPGFLEVGRDGAGSLLVQNGGTVAIGNGGSVVVQGTVAFHSPALALGTNADGTGTVTVSGTASKLTTTGTVAVGGAGQGALALLVGGELAAGALTLGQGSSVTVDAASAVDIGNGSTFVPGSIAIDPGHSITGSGLLAASVVNNGTIVVSSGTLEITGSLNGTGTIAIMNNAVLKLDGYVAPGQAIDFASGAGELILTNPAPAFAGPIQNLNTGDKIELGLPSPITNVLVATSGAVTVQTKKSTFTLSNVAYAAGAYRGFSSFPDPATGLWAIQVAPPTYDWLGTGTVLGSAASWFNDDTGFTAAAPPSAATMLNFGTSGTLTGTASGLSANFNGWGAWTLNGVALTLAGDPNPPAPPLALAFGTSATLLGSQITAAGSFLIGSSTGANVTLRNGSTVIATTGTIGASTGQLGALTLAAGSSWRDSQFTAIGGSGSGTLTVAGGTLVTSAGAALAANTGGSGSATIGAQGTWVANGGLAIGSGGTGVATIAGGGTLLLGSAGNTVGAAAGSHGTLVVSAGALVRSTLTTQAGGVALSIGDQAGSGAIAPANGAVIVNGSSALLNLNGNPLALGLHGGTGTLTVTNGGTVLAGTANSSQIAGTSLAGQGVGTLTVIGALSSFVCAGAMSVGAGGSGVLLVQNGGSVHVGFDPLGSGGLGIGIGSGALGSAWSGSGIATISAGACLVSDQSINVGGFGASGALSVQGATVQALGTMGIGLGAVVGGVSETSNGTVIIGAAGILEIEGGGITASATPALVLGGFAGSTGALAVNGPGALLNVGTFSVAVGAGGQGSLAVGQGGSVSAGTISVGAGGSGTASVAGIGSRVSAQSLSDGVSGVGALSITNGASLGVAQALTIGGAGALAIQGGAVVAGLVVNAGWIGGTGSLAATTLANSGMIYAAGGAFAVAGAIAGNGTLEAGPGGTLTLGGSVAAGQTIAFADATGTLVIDAIGGFAAGPITGFQRGDKIQIASQTPLTQSFNTVSDTLTLSGSGNSYHLSFTGSHQASDFVAAVSTIPMPAITTAPLASTMQTVTQNDTIVLPYPGQGFADIFGPVIGNGNLLDFRPALADTLWNGTSATLAQFVQLSTSATSTVISISPSGSAGGASYQVAKLEGSGAVSLSTVLTHALT